MSMRFYTPEKVTVCTRLAGDHQSGVLLFVIMQRYRYAKATLPGIEGTWSANTRDVWFKAAGLSETQGERRLTKLDKRGLIERAHGAWGRNPHVLHVRPTERTQIVWDTATTFLALDAVLGEEEDSVLHELWQVWDMNPKQRGVIATWYEQLEDGKNVKRYWGGGINSLKPYALDLLKQILELKPAIVDINAYGPDGLLTELWEGVFLVTKKLAEQEDAE